jgi:hypothetical protein
MKKKDIPILTIAIPTFNRLDNLKNQLVFVTEQIKKNKLHNNVEILISENTNDVSQLIKNQYLQKFKYFRITILRNKGNIGYAASLNKLIFYAKGKFCWLLSDDDFGKNNTLKSIIFSIKKNPLVDYFTFKTDSLINGKINKADLHFKDLLNHKKSFSNYLLINGNDFLKKYWLSVIFISVNIFNTRKMKSHIIKNKFQKITNIAYHNSLLCLTFIKNKKVCIILDALLTDVYGNKNYSLEGQFEMWVRSWQDIVKKCHDYELPIITIFKMRVLSFRNSLSMFKFSIYFLKITNNYLKILSEYRNFVKKDNFFFEKTYLKISFLILLLIKKNTTLRFFFYKFYEDKINMLNVRNFLENNKKNLIHNYDKS